MYGLKAYQGIANLNLWKVRRALIRQVHNVAYNIAKRGLIYTTYTEKDQIVVEGELVTVKDVPKWIDVLIFETDFVLKTDVDPTSRKFLVKVTTSKYDKLLPTGRIYDVTDKVLWDVLKVTP